MRNTQFQGLLACLIFIFAFQETQAQQYEEHFCGFSPSMSEIFSLDQLTPEINAYIALYKKGSPHAARQLTNLPIQFHVVTESSSAPLDTTLLVPFLDSLNKYFFPINVSFFKCGPIHFTAGPTPLNVSTLTTHPPFQTLFNRANVINIYFADKIVNGTTNTNGVAGFPFSENDAIFFSNSAVTQSPVCVHEMGHYFGLYHTFGKTNSCYTNPGNVPTPFAGELVDGSNCSFAGDDICDTPASPCLTGKVDTFCHYTGTVKDANNAPYLPDVGNFMEYSPVSCRNHFSPEQYARMAFFLDKYHASKACPASTGQYCTSIGLHTTKAWIERVKIANLDKNSGDNAGFGDFTSDTIRGVQGKMYALRLDPGFSCVVRPVYWRVFVDFNHDLDFDDEGEILFDNSTLSSISAVPIDLPFFMPYDAPPGVTRLRVSMRYPESVHGDFTGGSFNYGSAMPPNACSNIVNGEVEDYSLVVEADNSTNPYCVPPYIRPRLTNFVETANLGLFSKKFLNSSKYLFYTADTIELVRDKSYPPEESMVSHSSYIDFNHNKAFEWNNTPNNEYFQPTTDWAIPSYVLPGNTRARVGSPYEAGCDEYAYMDFVVKVISDPNLKYPLTTRFESSFENWSEAVALDTNLMITGPTGTSADFSTGIQLDLLREAEHEFLSYDKNNLGVLSISSSDLGIDTGNGFFDSKDVTIGGSIFPPREFSLFANSTLPPGTTRLSMPREGNQKLFGLQVISKCTYNTQDFSSSKIKIDTVLWNNKLLLSLSYPDLNHDVLPQTGAFTLKLSPSTDTALVKWYAWLDIDGDALFDGPQELLLSSGLVSGNQVFQLNLPAGVPRGLRKLRVRIISAYDPQVNNPDPCVAFQKGYLQEYGLYFNDFHLIGSNTWTPDNAGEFPFAIPMPLNEAWTIQGNSPWVSFTPSQGAGKDTVTLKYLKNDSGLSRTAVFTLQSATFLKKITITQLGTPVTGVPDTLYFAKEGGQIDLPLSIQAGSAPLRFFDMEPWVKAGLQNAALRINCEPNLHLKRQGRLVFRTKEGRIKSFVVIQAGKEAPYLEFSLDTLYLPGNRAGDTMITVHTNENFTYKNLLTPVWVWPYFGLKEDASGIITDPCSDHIYFRYADNTGGAWRYTVFEATTTTGLKRKLVVVQAGVVATEPEPKTFFADFSLFPNPSSGSFVVSELPPGSSDLSVYSVPGLRMFHANAPLGSTMMVPAQGWPQGLYVVELKGSFGVIRKKVFLVR